MNEEKPTVTLPGSARPAPWGRSGFHWRRPELGWVDIGISALLMLAVAVPTMAVEETWHGRPMIDQGTPLALVAACLVAAAFLAGGAVAGYRRPSAAAVHAVAAGGLTVAMLLVGAVIRRFWVAHEGVPHKVALLWFLGVVASLAFSVAGSEIGRWLAPDLRRG